MKWEEKALRRTKHREAPIRIQIERSRNRAENTYSENKKTLIQVLHNSNR
jgi:hypothetical protein